VSWGIGTAIFHGKQIYVQVDYRHHEWYRSPPIGFAPDGCTTRLDIAEFDGPPDWAPYLRQALSCGMVKVTGHAWVGGVRTIKLAGSQTDPHLSHCNRHSPEELDGWCRAARCHEDRGRDRQPEPPQHGAVDRHPARTRMPRRAQASHG
jgi:hypothetical protein